MEILDKLVLPQSAEHLRLLIYILGLTLIIFLPYAGILSAATFYSVILNVYGRQKEHNIVLRFSRELIEVVTMRKSFPIIFGLLPLITLIITYTQLLHKTTADIPVSLLIAFVLFSISILLIYFYKYTFYVDDVFRLKGEHPDTAGVANVKTDDVEHSHTGGNLIQPERSKDFIDFIQGNLKAHKIAAGSGIILLLLSAFIIIGSIQLSFQREYWASEVSFFKILLSYNSVVKFLYFLLASFALTNGGILYYYFRLKKNEHSEDEVYKNFILKFSLYSGITFAITLPFFVIVNLFTIPQQALSVLLFGITGLIIILLFILCHYFYVMIKYRNTDYISISFFVITAVFILFIINDQVAFSTSSQKHRVVLAGDYNQYVSTIQQEIQAAAADGEEIFDRLCTSCHRFDQQLVGPAYNNVLPKYEGNMEQLVSYIQTPTKVDPKFPPMPDLGLRPNEAQAVAEYIMNTYKK